MSFRYQMYQAYFVESAFFQGFIRGGLKEGDIKQVPIAFSYARFHPMTSLKDGMSAKFSLLGRRSPL